MVKKILVLTFFIVFAGVTSWFFIKSFTSDKFPVGSRLPVFSYSDTTGLKNMDNNQTGRTAIILFSVNCPYCKTLLAELNKNISQAKNVNFYLFAREKNLFDKIRNNKFNNLSFLLESNNVHFGFMNNNNAFDLFGTSSVPAIFIFDKNKLIKKFKGPIKINDILN